MSAEARFFDGETARDHAVTLDLLPEGLAIEGPEVTRRVWSFAGLIAITPMRSGYPLRLGHDAFPGGRLVITQEGFTRQLALSAPHLAGGPNLKRAGRLAAIIVASALLAIGALYATLAYAPQALAFVLPESWRKNLADQVEASFAGDGRLCATSADNPLLRGLSARLREGNPEAPPFELKVYDIDILNAFALPGGRIIMTRKLVDAAQGPAEIAGVLAHEIGHIHYRHAEAQLIRAMGVELLLQLVSGGGDSISGLAGLLAILRYSRDAEREADDYAQDMLIRADVDPMGLKRFFEEIKKLEGRQGSDGGLLGTVSDMMSTHPVTDERIASVKPLPEGAMARPVLSAADWANLQRVCK